MHEFAVIGSGVGGSSIAAALHAAGRDVLLFEKEPYLGGCSSTFTHGRYRYNTGATTLAGYQDGHPVKQLFDDIGYRPDLIDSDPAIVIVQNGKMTPRYRNLERFLDALERNYPHPRNRAFWTLVREIGNAFYAMHGYRYRNASLWQKGISLASFFPVFTRFGRYLHPNAERFIRDFFGTIDSEYMDFMQAQLFIVAQAPAREINFLTAALSLGYTFNRSHYVPGGMGRLFEEMTAPLRSVHRRTQITKIDAHRGRYVLHTQKGESYEAKNLILNTTAYDTPALFGDASIKHFYHRYQRLDNHQSSFMLYLTVRSDRTFHHHYQIIGDDPFAWTLSNALFVSVSDPSDTDLAPPGCRSITASIHTDARWWDDDAHYQARKSGVQSALLDTICATLGIDKSAIVHQFAATPKTFRRYILRGQLGGNPITMKNFLPNLPGNDTPFKGLYHVGDTVYAAQGWPGVMLGVRNLREILDV
jgi:phytoene dehydrogenase-like protein